MRGEVIAFDVETTGLDPETAQIIEVGAARCKDDEVIERFQTLINPGEYIPETITMLTGISNEDVENAPGIDAILPTLRAFIGDRPIVGHSIDFDLGMIRRYGMGQRNVRVDTLEIATVLLPNATRYTLTSLSQELGLSLENAHRALDDALASWQVYRLLWKQLLEVPMEILSEVIAMGEGLDWAALPAFEAAYALRTEHGEATPPRARFERTFQPTTERSFAPRLKPIQDSIYLEPDALRHKLSDELAAQMPDYEPRESQLEMLALVGEAFNAGEHLMIEAPTGTGKSLAYLLPAAQWALQNDERVVIATDTIVLQDQLLNKDIPLLQNALGMNVQAVSLKGRANYLCPRRLDARRRRKARTPEELRVMAKVLIWLSRGGSGEKSELNLRGSENFGWSQVSAQDDECGQNTCRELMRGACPYYKAHKTAESAHLVIVNHALLLSDVATGSQVIPPYDLLVLDEAHHIEDAITAGLALRLDKLGIQRRLSAIGDTKRGLLGETAQLMQRGLPESRLRRVQEWIETMSEAIHQLDANLEHFFETIIQGVNGGSASGEKEYGRPTARITAQVRNNARWGYALRSWNTLQEFTTILNASFAKLTKYMAGLPEDFSGDSDDFNLTLLNLETAALYFTELHDQFGELIEKPKDNTIYWVEYNLEYGNVVLNSAPLHVGALMHQHLWSKKHSVILTSATLRTANSFDFIAERLSADAGDVKFASVASPFDYKSSTLVYLPTDIPEPNQREEYQSMLEEGIIQLATATEGRMLCLFTSYTQLRETAQNIAPRLKLGDIAVLDQVSGSSRQLLVEDFKRLDRVVLMGTRSFWEGIDIPGADLSVVVIARLPFSVPSDPIFAARSESYGESAFLQYSVPDAILRFRQGFGRLIRRKDDRGVVVIFDKRITSKRYGQHFLESLPDVTIQRGYTSRLAQTAQEWLAK